MNASPSNKIASTQHLKFGIARQNIYIIFIEFCSTETSNIISFLRDNQFAPRGKNIDSIDQLLEAFSERSWDLIICQPQKSAFDPYLMARTLAELEKDIPVLQLREQPDKANITEGLLNNIQAVIPRDDYPLLLLFIQREYSYLQSRRSARLLQLQLSDSHKRCKMLMDHSALAIAIIHNQKIIYLNDAFCNLFGFQVHNNLLHKPILNLVASQERSGFSKLLAGFIDSGQNMQPYQVLAKRADNSNFTAHLEIQQVHYQQKDCIEIIVDNTRNLHTEHKFSELDAITGLYSIDFFTEALESNVKLAHRGGNNCHLLYIDVLNLKNIRSHLGNEAFITIARDIADILNEEFSKSHLIARLNDNIFAVIYLDPNSKKTEKLAYKLQARLNSHVTIYKQEKLQTENVIAIVTLTDTAPSAQQLIERAQRAIVQSENSSENPAKVVWYHPKKSTATSSHQQQSIVQVREAIAQGKLRLLFQPLVPLVFASEQQHYEVLLRMIGTNNENILPANFLSSFSHANLNEEMDRWVIAQSINQFRHELDNNKQPKLFISVTDTVWEREALLLWIAESLRKSRIQADHIVIQISELESANKLAKAKYFVDGLRQLNCLVCLKHYGSTNNSQSILQTLDPDYVKFDGSYIRELTEEPASDLRFKSLLSHLKNLGKVTIAPQVETPKVMRLLWKSGVSIIQGHYLQAPEEEMHYDFDQ
ncbi:MAG: hypothetical protein OFPII_19490 [Osedax symbiont Rs1]|nr:MAG: hypothetical protein OFPII_19490 [Osedax symbiont Rs1]